MNQSIIRIKLFSPRAFVCSLRTLCMLITSGYATSRTGDVAAKRFALFFKVQVRIYERITRIKFWYIIFPSPPSLGYPYH